MWLPIIVGLSICLLLVTLGPCIDWAVYQCIINLPRSLIIGGLLPDWTIICLGFICHLYGHRT